jgi:predicted TIM-barrel fold metal-dependent hydrolase
MERTRGQGSPTRRDIVASAAAGASALLAGKLAWAQAARSPGRIDLHHHCFPPAFLDAQRHAALWQSRPAALSAALEGWSKARTIEAMDRYGIAIGILSISTPGPWFGNIEESQRLARECNEYAAEMMRDHPGRFGLFAALPLPDPDAALREIDYAFDTLHADGVAIMTSYATSAGTTWPGDASLAPVFAELNRRKAVAFVHLGRVGSSQLCCGNVVSGVPDVMAETPHEMTRAIMSLLFNGTLSRNPDIRFIFTNAGGTVPMLSGRIAAATKRLGAEFDRLVPNGANTNSRSFSTRSRTRPRRQASPPLPRSYRRRRSSSAPTILLCRSRPPSRPSMRSGRARCAIPCTARMPRRCCRASREPP